MAVVIPCSSTLSWSDEKAGVAGIGGGMRVLLLWLAVVDVIAQQDLAPTPARREVVPLVQKDFALLGPPLGSTKQGLTMPTG